MLRQIASRLLTNRAGWKTARKIVVIESDDWGSIRMPSRDAYMACLKAGYHVDRTEYERYDSILSQHDLELLFSLLSEFRDKNGRHPVITANCVVANPDFQRIEADNFMKYSYEPVTRTFKRFPQFSNNFEIWQQGIAQKIFFPQFHAREHLNVSLFMTALQNGDADALFSLRMGMPGIIAHGPVSRGNYYVEATNFRNPGDKKQKLDIILDGLDLFRELFGYRSESLIPPNFTWSDDYNEPVLQRGIIYFQGLRKIREPLYNDRYRYHSHYLGKRNNLGQLYLVRNALFEPSMLKLGINDPVTRCLRDMAIAFSMHKPVIISSHRLNYSGLIDQANRDRTLKLLKELLSRALRRWPDIEFFTTSDLGAMIRVSDAL